MKKKKYYFFSRYLDKGEVIVHVAHRHILIFKIDAAKSSFFGIFLPMVFYLFFPQLWIVVAVWLFVGLLAILYHLINWYFDVWLLTNLGVIDIDRDGLFDVTTTRIDYHMIEGISYNIKGFVRTVFNYGDITIDKLGAKTSVMLRDAANPKRLERKVMEYQERFISEKSIRDHHALKDMLSDMIAYHVQNEKIKPPNK